jgi:hypothetical protein
VFAGFQLGGPADEKGHADAAFVVGVFASTKRGVVSVLCQWATVVADEEEEGVFPATFAFQGGDDFAHRVIEALAHGEQGVAVFVAGVELGDFVIGCLEGSVDGVEGEVGEERFGFVSGDLCCVDSDYLCF